MSVTIVTNDSVQSVYDLQRVKTCSCFPTASDGDTLNVDFSSAEMRLMDFYFSGNSPVMFLKSTTDINEIKRTLTFVLLYAPQEFIELVTESLSNRLFEVMSAEVTDKQDCQIPHTLNMIDSFVN